MKGSQTDYPQKKTVIKLRPVLLGLMQYYYLGNIIT